MPEPGFGNAPQYSEPATSGVYVDPNTKKRRRYQLYPDPASLTTGWTRKDYDPLDSSNNGRPTESFSPYDLQADQEAAQSLYNKQKAKYDYEQGQRQQQQAADATAQGRWETYYNNQADYAERTRQDALSEGAAGRRNAIDLAKERIRGELGLQKGTLGMQREQLGFERDKFGQGLAWDKDKFGQQLGWDKDRFGQQLGFDKFKNADDTRLRALSAYGQLRLPGNAYSTMAAQAAGLMPQAGMGNGAPMVGTGGGVQLPGGGSSTLTPEQWQAFIDAGQTDQNYKKLGQGRPGAA